MMPQDSNQERPKPFVIRQFMPEREIPGLGAVMLRTVIVRTSGEADQLARQAPDADKANAFANHIISWMLSKPDQAPPDIESLPPETIAALSELASDSLGSREEFDALSSDLPPRERLYQSHLEAERAHFATQARAIDAARKRFEASMRPIYDAAQAAISPSFNSEFSRERFSEFLKSTAAISSKLLADEIAVPQGSQLAYLLDAVEAEPRRILESAMESSLADLVEQASKVALPEPILSDTLIALGINSPLLHSPTFVLPSVETLGTPADIESRAEDVERQRLVGAYDVLVQLEFKLRELIEQKLREKHGRKWWKAGVPPEIQGKCEQRKSDTESGREVSHSPLAYAYVDDYRAIIEKRDNWKEFFSPIFGSTAQLQACFMWVGRSRVDIAHPRPLSDDEYMYFMTGAHWIQAAIARAADEITEET